MPGMRLSKVEETLRTWWHKPPSQWKRPVLRAIEISGGTGLRGIDGLLVPFRYPITAICGPNGCGKSTILALAALAYHSPLGWLVHWGPTQPQRAAENATTYYTFTDFFVQAKGDPPVEDVTITWRLSVGEQEISHTVEKKKKGGWGRYDRRPEREVAFLPLGRLVPAHEMTGVRTAFSGSKQTAPGTQLNEESLKLLSYILGREYNEAIFEKEKRWHFQRCRTSAAYTAFNMGGGESYIIALLHLLQSLPPAGLLIVEEIEAGLHPQAQVRLSEVLINACLKKHIQVICSTHSAAFLDALPRPARLLLTRTGNEHSVYESPTTRFAIYQMTGIVEPEVVIYCEDMAASLLIEEALPQELRRRVKILPVGSDATVIRQGVAHLKAQMPMRLLCVLDGDCTESKMQGWVREERGHYTHEGLNVLILPGDGSPPERWVRSQLEHEDYLSAFAKQFACNAFDARSHIDALKVDSDHHDLAYTMQQRTGIDKESCLRRVMASVALRHPQLDALREKVAALLETK